MNREQQLLKELKEIREAKKEAQQSENFQKCLEGLKLFVKIYSDFKWTKDYSDGYELNLSKDGIGIEIMFDPFNNYCCSQLKSLGHNTLASKIIDHYEVFERSGLPDIDLLEDYRYLETRLEDFLNTEFDCDEEVWKIFEPFYENCINYEKFTEEMLQHNNQIFKDLFSHE